MLIEFAEENWKPGRVHFLRQILITEDGLYPALGVIEIAMDTDDLHILTLLGHHLLLLYGADAVLRVEYHNSGTRHTRSLP